MKRFKGKTNNLKRFFSEEIWDLELEELSRAKARFIKYVKVAIITTKTYAQQKIGPQAVALSYLSVMALVPFLAIVFAITGGLGVDGLLKEFMYENFSSNQGVIDTVLSFSQNIIDTAQSGWMGFFNAFLFLLVGCGYNVPVGTTVLENDGFQVGVGKEYLGDVKAAIPKDGL